ncbi:unnamed protein product [Symbiodinium sp. CCMP2592]|nr:unnamed protein product [Symbiodinium sp. CCMP2592]
MLVAHCRDIPVSGVDALPLSGQLTKHRARAGASASAVQEEQEEPLVTDAVFSGFALPRLATECVGVTARKTAVLRVLALPQAAQLAILDRRTSPVYKYTVPPKAAANTCFVLSACLRRLYGLQVRGRLHSAEEWTSDALYETGSDTEGSDTVGDSVPVGCESAMDRNHG